jgi:outer membrane protein
MNRLFESESMSKIFILLLGGTLWAQEPLSLRQAAQLAIAENKAIAATASAVRAAGTRTTQARSGFLPKVNYSESFTRSDNPVFVFGSLLTQHQFGVDNFNIGPLNRPDALNNSQSLLTVDQTLYDAGQTRHAVQSARMGQQLTGEEKRRVEMETIAGVVRAYYGALLAAESLKTAEQAVRSAEADLRRAQDVRSAGMSTDVDVLSIRVHLAAVNEQRIQRTADVEVARAALNDALGLPLDASHTLTTGLTPLAGPKPALDGLEREAAASRPEVRESHLAKNLAQNQAESARSAMLPQISFRAAFEADRQRFVTRAGVNWLASVSLRWNLFNGFADKARMEESSHLVQGAEADEQRVSSAIRLQVRRSYADLDAARQRIDVATAAVAQAEESLRITQNRYQAGMANVTDLLRTETALLESRTRYLAAVHDERVAAAQLELAAGRLTADSEVLD